MKYFFYYYKVLGRIASGKRNSDMPQSTWQIGPDIEITEADFQKPLASLEGKYPYKEIP